MRMAPHTGLAALVLALLTASAAAAWAARPTDYRPCRGEGRSRICVDPGSGGSSAPPPLWSLLPPNGAGAPVMDPSGVCDAFASELVGSYVCLRGDGTSVRAPGITLTEFGQVTDTAPRICPNGPDCAAVPVQSFDTVAASQINTNTIPTPGGDFSMCVLSRVRTENDVVPISLLAANTALQTRVNSQPTNLLFRVGGTNLLAPSPTMSGGWNFVCGTYRRIGGGATNVGILYANGGSIGTNSTMNPPGGTVLSFGSPSTPQAANDIALALYTEKELSAATIKAMSDKVFGVWKTGEDVAVGSAYIRTSVASCKGPDGWLTVLPSLRPCIKTPPGFDAPALETEVQRTNSIIRSQELDTWTAAGATATANLVVAPDSTLTAEQLTDDTSTGEHVTTRAITAGTSLAHVLSVFFKAGTRSVGVIKYAATHYGYVDLNTGTATVIGTGATAAAEQFPDGWWRLKVIIPIAQTTLNPTIGIGMAGAAGTPSYTGDGTGTIYAWGAQGEVAPVPHVTSYIRADASATTRIRSKVEMAPPPGMVEATGCMSWTALISYFEPTGTYTLGTNGGLSNEGLITNSVSAVSCSDGTPGVQLLGLPDMRVTPLRAWCSWGPGGRTLGVGALRSTGTYDGALLGTSISIGDKNTLNHGPFNGWIGNVKFGDKPNACN